MRLFRKPVQEPADINEFRDEISRILPQFASHLGAIILNGGCDFFWEIPAHGTHPAHRVSYGFMWTYSIHVEGEWINGSGITIDRAKKECVKGIRYRELNHGKLQNH